MLLFHRVGGIFNSQHYFDLKIMFYTHSFYQKEWYLKKEFQRMILPIILPRVSPWMCPCVSTPPPGATAPCEEWALPAGVCQGGGGVPGSLGQTPHHRALLTTDQRLHHHPLALPLWPPLLLCPLPLLNSLGLWVGEGGPEGPSQAPSTTWPKSLRENNLRSGAELRRPQD